MSEFPDRLSVDPKSPHFHPIYRQLGVRLNGIPRKNDVHEYCISEGWIIVRGAPVGDHYSMKTLHGTVEVFSRVQAATAASQRIVSRVQAEKAAIDAAEAKRARKAAKRLQIAQGVAR